jgi:hypothetical protein
MEGVDLEFRDEALRAMARKAMERKTGARGLRSIRGRPCCWTPCMTCPPWKAVSKVVIDETVIKGDSAPLMIYDNPETQAMLRQSKLLIFNEQNMKKGLFAPFMLFTAMAIESHLCAPIYSAKLLCQRYNKPRGHI